MARTTTRARTPSRSRRIAWLSHSERAPTRARHRALHLVLPVVLAAGLAAGGCRKSEPPKSAGATDTAELDRLRSLPYLGGTPAHDDDPVGVVRRDPERSCPGYSLCVVQMLSRADLIDEEGGVLRSWSYTPSDRWERANLLPNGDLVVVGADPHVWADGTAPDRIADDARYVMRFDWDGRVLWKKPLRAHHDITATPDGKLLVLTFQRRLLPEIDAHIPVRDDQLTLLDPDGNVLASHSLLDAVQQSRDVFHVRSVRPSTLGGPPWLDVFHSNSAQWMNYPQLVVRHPLYNLGNILVCFRHQSQIAVFNWQRNDVVWAWGEGELSGPHDAQVLENGNILLLDNGLTRGASRALELDPLTRTIVWRYEADPPTAFFTASQGSVQRLPNGNTLLVESDRGRAFEVTPAGEVVWEFVTPHRLPDGQRAAIVRMRRVPHDYVPAAVPRAKDGSAN